MWSEEMDKAFLTLNEIFTTPLVLSYPLADRPFIVETDKSVKAVDVVLVQKQKERKIHPIQFISLTTNPLEKNHSESERETLAVIFAQGNFRLSTVLEGPTRSLTSCLSTRGIRRFILTK